MSDDYKTLLRLPADLEQKIKAEAKAERRTINAQMIVIIEQYFKSKKK
jgi:hypothetical protein